MASAYRFGSFELRPDQRQLLVDGHPAALGSRAFDVLLVLAERTGQLVTKNELLDLVWPGVIVEENNLQVQISTLRKLLGPEVIVTIPGRGYRLAMTPANASPSTGAADTAASLAQAERTKLADASKERAALYGRGEDVAALAELIVCHPLVTVVGPAGIGKTRLAQAVVHGLRDEFANSVRVVELASLTDPDLVAGTVARALGVGVGDAPGALEFVVQALASQCLLLVLDNCEHLLEAVDRVVVALRHGAPGVRILATSQELLRHPEEQVYRLGPLGLPADATLAGARDAGAVQLLVARVQALEPRFRLSENKVDAVVEICRRLDGIPLALELAAARVPLLGVEGVRDRLDERFRLLTAGSRLALRRHQTLRAALEWSYSLLSEAEKELFDQLGVFAGSFSLECAQQLAAGADMDQWAVLDHLGALVDKSLVSVEEGTSARYRMLETTRAFALERLTARGATMQAMRRHAEVMLALFEGFHRTIRQGTPSAQVHGQVSADLDNVRSALQWAGGSGGDRRIAIALFGAAVAGYGYFHYSALRAQSWIELLSPLVDDSIPAPDVARFWLACADWRGYHAPPAAIDDARRALVLYGQLDDRLGLCRSWTTLAYALSATGQRDEANHALAEVLRLRDPAWPPWLGALVDNMAALVLANFGDIDDARRHALAFLDVARRFKHGVDVRTALKILINIECVAGHLDEALAMAQELLAAHPALWERVEDGRGFRDIASTLMLAGRLDEAEPLFREALLRLRRNYGDAVHVLYDVTMFVALRGRLDDAARLLAHADTVYARRAFRPRRLPRRFRRELIARLEAAHSKDTLDELFDEGRRLTDDEACALVSSGPLPER